MTEAVATTSPTGANPAHDLAPLRQAGAPAFDAVGWHYIEVLAAKVPAHSGAAQVLLQGKLDQALRNLQARMAAAKSLTLSDESAATAATSPATLSPLAQLLQELAPVAPPPRPTGKSATWRAESPRVRQFRKTLSQLSVQKQVTQAIAQAPQNAGPINSHMLVLRSLGLMRELSPDYLNRFMAYVDTLLCLEEAGKAKPVTKKPAANGKPQK